jgi:hypothetical protein
MDKLNKLSEERSKNNQDKISVCMKVNETKPYLFSHFIMAKIMVNVFQITFHYTASFITVNVNPSPPKIHRTKSGGTFVIM